MMEDGYISKEEMEKSFSRTDQIAANQAQRQVAAYFCGKCTSLRAGKIRC